MQLQPFELERWASVYENAVEYNLSESGVHPATLSEIGMDPQELAKIRIGYPQSNGTDRFRALAAAIYPGATERNIVATSGGIDANFQAVLRLLEPGDDALLILPNYMQVHGLVQSLGGRVIPVWLRQENNWLPDPAEIADKITRKTKFISFSNPNNPTGAVFGRDTIRAIVSLADKYGSWILADEVYQGAERNGERTPTFWGEYPKTLVTQSFSKAYGTPGLRLGWLLGPEDMIRELWAQADYTRIAPPVLSDFVACRVLENREKIYGRTRTILNHNWPNLKRWLDEREHQFSYVEPKAGAISFVKYRHSINSKVLAERLRSEKSTLIVPGDHFAIDHYLRIGFGTEMEYTDTGLRRIGELFDSITKD